MVGPLPLRRGCINQIIANLDQTVLQIVGFAVLGDEPVRLVVDLIGFIETVNGGAKSGHAAV